MSASDALKAVAHASRTPLRDLKVFDLILDGDAPTDIWHGVYAFFDPAGICLYVGKNSSQNFVERIPWHFSLHEDAWMNHFLKYLRRHQGLTTLGEAAMAARNCELLLMPMAQYELITAFEKFLRIFLAPKFNMYSQGYRARYAGLDLSEPLGAVLGQFV